MNTANQTNLWENNLCLLVKRSSWWRFLLRAIRNSNTEEALRITTDRKNRTIELWKGDFSSTYQKKLSLTGQKLSALLRLFPNLHANKRRIMPTSTVKSQLNYYRLIQIFCRGRLNSLINPFSTNVPILYPLKTESFRFSVFKGYRSGTLVEDGLTKSKKDHSG